MDSHVPSVSKQRYRVLIDSLVTEGRVFKRDDTLTPEDAPGEIEAMLHAGIIEREHEAIQSNVNGPELH